MMFKKEAAKLRKINFLHGCQGNSYICCLVMRSSIKITFLVAIVGLTSCFDQPDCISPTTDFVNVLFYKAENNERDTLLINSLTAIGSDSVLVTNDEVTGVDLPLLPSQRSVTFIFDSELGLDTLVLSYEPRSRLVSEECGIDIIFSELDYIRNDFDSISVVNNILIEDVNEDIRIFN